MTDARDTLVPPTATAQAWFEGLEAAGQRLPPSQVAELRPFLERLAAAAPAARPDPDRLIAAIGASRFLRRFLTRHPEAADELADQLPERDADAWLAVVREATADVHDEASLVRDLRIVRHRAYLGLAAREITTGDPLASGRDLASLAAACLQVALDRWGRWLAPRFGRPKLADGSDCGAVIIGLGKLGGQELNYSSDIDLIYVYEDDAGETDGGGGLGRKVDLHTYFDRLFGAVTRTLSAVTEEGFAFRVDLHLRPEGRSGPIANSVDGLERYYEAFGNPWERLAWLKARPVAGDLALGQRVLKRLEPFVYRRSLDYTFLNEVAVMKGRIDARATRLARRAGFDVELGHGGIREIEFTIQALQLIWGGRQPELRVRGTGTAIRRLALAGVLESAEGDSLLGAYRFLRRVEHALQLVDDQQTPWLADGTSLRTDIALVVAGAEHGAEAPEHFERQLAEHRRRVRFAFDGVLAGEAGARLAEGIDAVVAAVLDGDTDRETRVEALADLGFGAPERAVDWMDALIRRPDSPFHPRQLATGGGLARALLLAVRSSPDPDGALMHLESLIRAVRHRGARALEQLEQDPRRLRVLAGLFGSSHFLSRKLVRSPGLLDRLVFDGSEPAVKTAAEMAATLAAEPRVDGDWEDTLGAVRRFHQAEVLRIGFFDLAGVIDVPTVGRQLSDLADTIVRRVVGAAEDMVGRRFDSDASDLGVIAMGKLAGRELNYASDLDLLFVYDGATAGAELMSRVARHVITGLSVATPQGTLYEIGTRLRPSGRQGALCVTGERLLSYHRAEAQIWERQASLRSRAVCGDVATVTVAQLREAGLGALVGRGAEAAQGIGEMRARAGTEAGDKSGRYDLKVGLDGLLDIESLVQLVQLMTAAPASLDAPAASANTAVALRGLADAGALSAEDASTLGAAYAYLRLLENRLRIVHDRPVGTLPGSAALESDLGATDELRRLAVRMGYGASPEEVPGKALVADYERYRGQVREVFERALAAAR